MKNLAVLVSGSGSNLQAIIDSTKNGILKNKAKVVLVISNNPNAYALKRAQKENILNLSCPLAGKVSTSSAEGGQLLSELNNFQIDLICLAGYMQIISKDIVEAYKNKILNIHPALLPKFGGKGMYGHFVHEAVIKAKEKKSGATVHFVDENYDTGKIILQEEVDVLESDTPDDLAKRVLEVEHKIYPLAIKKVIERI